MMEKSVVLESGDLKLEGLLDRAGGDAGVVITHPHPQYGGSMQNNVVESLVKSYGKAGYTTLRFNFRGMGKSEGHYDEGVGEQADVRGAVAYLKGLGMASVDLAGYSFGARMNASVVSSGYKLSDNIMVSPPMGFMSFDDAVSMPSTGLIITGADDKIAPSAMVQAAIKRWQISPRFEVIEGCDHFYTTGMTKLRWILSDYLA